MNNKLSSYLQPLEVDGQPVIARPQEHGDVTVLNATADIRLGDTFSEVHINELATLARLREEGLTEAQIAATSIQLSADTSIADGRGAKLGLYDDTHQTIHLYPAASLAQIHLATHALMRAEGLGDDFTVPLNDLDVFESARLSESLWHEIRHARQHLREHHTTQDNAKHYEHLENIRRRGSIAKFAGAIVIFFATREFIPMEEPNATLVAANAALATWYGSSIALTRHLTRQTSAAYANNPDEIDAREAQQDAPAKAIHLVPRKGWDVAQLPKGTISRRELINTAAKLL